MGCSKNGSLKVVPVFRTLRSWRLHGIAAEAEAQTVRSAHVENK